MLRTQQLAAVRAVVRTIAQVEDPHAPARIGATGIGGGCFRFAYLLDGFVIKRRSSTEEPPEDRRDKFDCLKADYQTLGVRRAPTIVVGNWEVQRYYRPLTPAEQEHYSERFYRSECSRDGDAHAKNVGRDHRGRLVAFDW